MAATVVTAESTFVRLCCPAECVIRRGRLQGETGSLSPPRRWNISNKSRMRMKSSRECHQGDRFASRAGSHRLSQAIWFFCICLHVHANRSISFCDYTFGNIDRDARVYPNRRLWLLINRYYITLFILFAVKTSLSNERGKHEISITT